MSRTMTHDEAVRIGRIGGLRLSALHDPKEYTANARRKFRRSFYDATPADLPEVERERRAEAGFKAHMAQLAYRSAQARRK